VTASSPAETAPASDILDGERLYADVVAYSELGDHRTTSRGDFATSQWIAERLAACHLNVWFATFETPQFDLRQAELAVGGDNVECFPLWPVTPTPSGGIGGPPARWNGNDGEAIAGRVALLELPYDPRATIMPGAAAHGLLSSAIAGGATAVLAITNGPSGEIIAQNCPLDTAAWGVPVVLVAPRDAPRLDAACEHGDAVTLRIDGVRRERAIARNVIATAEPADSHAAEAIVVSTPISGWFRCGGERGPGVALFLGVAAWVAARRPSIRYVFVATSGHELDGLGMRSFLASGIVTPDRVRCWMHLGAGIATFAWEDTERGPRKLTTSDPNRFLMCSPGLEEHLRDAFSKAGRINLLVGRGVGEMALIFASGYRGFGIAGAHRFHHTPADGPDSTAPHLLAPVAGAIADVLQTVEPP
jgi:hypothetical protein